MSGQLNQRGQAHLVNTVLAIVVGFMVLSLGITLVSNFQGNIITSPQNAVPFNTMWPMVVAGVLILAAIVSITQIVKV